MNTKTISLLAGLILIAAACSSDDPEMVNEEELITTVNISFTNNGSTDEVVMATFRDLDGPGGENPTIDNITLNANASYTVRVEFLNEQANPAEDVTEEVLAEGADHQVFYIVGGNTSIDFTYGDQDVFGNPIGLLTTATTGDAANGALSVVLVHEPNKSVVGVSDGNISAAGGEEDIRVQFQVSIQ